MTKIVGATDTKYITVTPVLTVAAAYASGDYIGTSASCMTFSNAVDKVGSSGRVTGCLLVDAALQSLAGELWLFDTVLTPPADSAAWTMTDAVAATCIGVIPLPAASYYASAVNSVCKGVPAAPLAFVCGSTSKDLFGVFVTRDAPAYASGDLTFRLSIIQD